MKRIIIMIVTIAFVLLGVFFISHSKTEKITQQNFSDCNEKNYTISQSGCCSWHGGVCDCGFNGRVICCDGQYSPSCTCNSPDILKKSEDNFKL